MPFSLGGIRKVKGDAYGQRHYGGHVECLLPTFSALLQTNHRRRIARRSTVSLKYALSPALAHRHPQPGCGDG